MDAREHITWALRFKELPLETLTTGERLTLLGTIHEFFVPPDSWRIAVLPYGVPLTDSAEALEEIRQLQEKVRVLFAGLVRTKQAWGESPPEIILQEIKIRLYSHPPLANPDPAAEENKGKLCFAVPSWQEAFLLLLSFHLWQENLDSLKACPECDKIFLRVRRQLFCSRACTNKATVRTWRKTPKGKTMTASSSRARYERKVRKKLPHARIGKKRPKA